MVTPTPTPGPAIHNATSSFGSAAGIGPVVVVMIYVLAAVVAAQVFLPWLARSSLLNETARRFVRSLNYAVKGIAASIVAVLAAAPFYLLLQADGSTRAAVGKYAGFAVAGYVFLVIVGWLAERATALFWDAHPDYDELADVLGTEEEPEETAEAAD